MVDKYVFGRFTRVVSQIPSGVISVRRGTTPRASWSHTVRQAAHARTEGSLAGHKRGARGSFESIERAACDAIRDAASPSAVGSRASSSRPSSRSPSGSLAERGLRCGGALAAPSTLAFPRNHGDTWRASSVAYRRERGRLRLAEARHVAPMSTAKTKEGSGTASISAELLK